MAMKRFACMLLARAARSTKPCLGAVAVISSMVCSKPASTKACLISRASWRLKAYSGIPRALIAPGTSTVWPTSTTTRNEARAQLSEAAWLMPWARSPSTPAASRVIATTTNSFVAARIPLIPFASYCIGRKFAPSGSRGDEATRGHDDPLTVLPFDALHPAKAGKRAVAGNLEEVAVAIFDERMPAAYAKEDPIRQDFCFSWSRWTVRNCARGLRGGGSRCSGRSQHALSFLLEPIDGFGDTSKLRIWFGLRALDAVEAIGQPGKLIIGAASRALDVCLERG